MKNPFHRSVNIMNVSVPEKFVMVAQDALTLRQAARKMFRGMPDRMEFSHAEITFLLRTVNPLSSEVDAEQATQFAELVHFTTRWAAFGFPHFKLSQDLTSALVLTDCSGISAGEIKWPFPSFMLSLPEESPIVFKDTEGDKLITGRHIMAHSMLVPDDKDEDTYGRAFQEAFNKAEWEAEKRNEPENLWKFYQKHLQKVPLTTATVIRCLDSIDHYSIFHANRWPRDDKPIAGWISCSGPDRTPFLENIDRYGMMASARLVANFMLYLSEQKNEGKWSPKNAVNVMARTSKGFNQTPTTWIMGSEIKLPDSFHSTARSYCAQGHGAGSRKEFKVRAQQVVMGHWRRQSIREKQVLETSRHHAMDGRAQRWIQPYERNKDHSLGFRKTYTVDVKKP